jgi:hypothetical protein
MPDRQTPQSAAFALRNNPCPLVEFPIFSTTRLPASAAAAFFMSRSLPDRNCPTKRFDMEDAMQAIGSRPRATKKRVSQAPEDEEAQTGASGGTQRTKRSKTSKAPPPEGIFILFCR